MKARRKAKIWAIWSKLKRFLYFTVFNIDLFAVARHKKICDEHIFFFSLQFPCVDPSFDPEHVLIFNILIYVFLS